MNSRICFRKICSFVKDKSEKRFNIYITDQLQLHPGASHQSYRNMATDLKPTGPPECLLKPMNFPRKTLMGPGPSNAPPRVLNASSLPLLGHLHPEFLQVFVSSSTLLIKELSQAGRLYIFQVIISKKKKDLCMYLCSEDLFQSS